MNKYLLVLASMLLAVYTLTRIRFVKSHEQSSPFNVDDIYYLKFW